MRITKVDDQGYDNRYIWPKGWYACAVIAAGEGESKAGNGYFKVEVEVFRGDGASRVISHIIMAEGTRAWMLRNACEAFGIMAAYESENITPRDLLDGKAMAMVEVEKSKAYPTRNIIVEFAATAPEPRNAVRSARSTERSNHGK